MIKNLFVASLLWLSFGAPIAMGADAKTQTIGVPANDYDSYLSDLTSRIKSRWKYPDNVTGVQKVAIRFAIDRDGNLVSAEVLESSDPTLNGSLLEAVKRASPFSAIPESLKDLANQRIIIRFEIVIRGRGSR